MRTKLRDTARMSRRDQPCMYIYVNSLVGNLFDNFNRIFTIRCTYAGLPCNNVVWYNWFHRITKWSYKKKERPTMWANLIISFLLSVAPLLVDCIFSFARHSTHLGEAIYPLILSMQYGAVCRLLVVNYSSLHDERHQYHYHYRSIIGFILM